jgi:hypothetical protein
MAPRSSAGAVGCEGHNTAALCMVITFSCDGPRRYISTLNSQLINHLDTRLAALDGRWECQYMACPLPSEGEGYRSQGPVGLRDVWALGVVRRRGYKVGPKMAVRLSALPTGRSLPAGRFLVLISVISSLDPRAVVRLEGSAHLKYPVI